jgi:hypothetical protein
LSSGASRSKPKRSGGGDEEEAATKTRLRHGTDE